MDDSFPEFSDGCFPSITEALKFCPEIAVIANPATFHVSMAELLAQVGAHLLIEKPLSVESDGIKDFLKICVENDVILLVGYNLRFLPSLQYFQQSLKKDDIGKVLSVRCEVGQYLPSWRPGTDYRKGVSARNELGGGVLLELSHELDYLSWIFGKTAWVKANLSRQSELEIDVEDTAYLILGFEPSAEGHQVIAAVSMDFIRHDRTRLCTAVGQEGSLRWNGILGTVEKFDAGGAEWVTTFRAKEGSDASYQSQWVHFLDCIEGKDIPQITGNDGLQVLRIIDAARQATDTMIKLETT